MKALGIDNVLFGVGDLDRAIDFYGSSIGFPLKFKVDDAGVAAFQIGDEEPGLLVRSQEEAPRFWVEVADARAFAEELTGRGVAPRRAPFEVYTGWAFEVEDPWGNVIGFTDYLKDPAKARIRR